VRRNGETAIGGRYVTLRVVLTPGAELSSTGVSLTVLTEHVHSDGAIPPGQKCLLLMNLDEKDFLLGQALKVKVVCSRGRYNAYYTQDRNRKIVTVVECIAVHGRVIPPRCIYKGGKHLLEWHAGVQDKEQPTFAWLTKGSTDTELGMEWVEQHNGKYTIKIFIQLD